MNGYSAPRLLDELACHGRAKARDARYIVDGQQAVAADAGEVVVVCLLSVALGSGVVIRRVGVMSSLHCARCIIEST